MMRLIAALLFFTRLPLWRRVQPPAEAYRHVVVWWPLTGWLTAGLAAGVLYGAGQLLPVPAAVVLALAARMLLSGALHEDGLADFVDGFGGGGADRERILAIMKDSHIGTYGVLSLIVYFLLMISLLGSLPLATASLLLLCGDPLSKGVAAQLPNLLPYARTQAQSKSGIVYDRMTPAEGLACAAAALLPLLILPDPRLWIAALAPLLAFAGVYNMMKRRLGGYSGDCCGAVCLLGELAFYLTAVMLWNLS